MNVIKKSYQYLFYKLYKFFQSIPYPWLSDVKSMALIIILFGFIFLEIAIYFRVFIDPYTDILPNKYPIVGIVLFLSILNYFVFSYKDKWKKIVKDFDQLPKKKNRLGGWLVLVFVILVFANLFYSFYLMSQIDWSQYR